MLKKKIPVYYGILLLLCGGLITYLICLNVYKSSINEADSSDTIPDSLNYKYKISRLKGYPHVKPLLFADREAESNKYGPLKMSISALVENAKKAGNVISASVYIRVFAKGGEWIAYNPDETYSPGSLLKVPVLITFLRIAENNPVILNQEIPYIKSDTFQREQAYESKTIQVGKKYTVKELLHYMIAYSDNRATVLLEHYMDTKLFKKTFTDLGLKEPSETDQVYPITVKEYSKFIEVLYNATYLSINYSEYAASLLCESTFKDGLVRELPSNIQVAHKFGESGDVNVHELHESGLVYINNRAYLITIMTKGTDLKKLSTVIGDISKAVYDNVSVNIKPGA